jgi:carbon monoxide dehydrogenase subunit G
MLQINATTEIDAPANEVWRKIAKLDEVQHYVESVTKSYYSSEQTEGVGAERTCEVQGFGTLQEKIVQWDEGESLTYTVDGMPRVIRSAQSHWAVEAITPFKTRISVQSTIETRYGVLGAAMAKYLMKPRMTRLLEGALASFRDFVEHSTETPRTQGQPLQARLA